MSFTALRTRVAIIVILSALIVGCPAPTPTVPEIHFSNIGDGRPVESGFVVGTAASPGSAIVLVEVRVDGGAWEPASGAASWRFKLPTGVSAWNPGSSHTVTARARDAQGAFSTELAATVFKGSNRGVDGDGYADLVVGAPLYGSWQGRVYLFRGGPSGLGSTDAGSASAILTGEEVDPGPYGSQFGYSVALDDVDGNGFADLAVGAPSARCTQRTSGAPPAVGASAPARRGRSSCAAGTAPGVCPDGDGDVKRASAASTDAQRTRSRCRDSESRRSSSRPCRGASSSYGRSHGSPSPAAGSWPGSSAQSCSRLWSTWSCGCSNGCQAYGAWRSWGTRGSSGATGDPAAP